MVLKIIVLQRYYGLGNKQVEYQIIDRTSFKNFLGLETGYKLYDEKTVRTFRESLAQKGLVEDLFEQFKDHFITLELTVSYLIGKEQRMHLYTEVKNMFEVKYQTLHGYPDKGRMISASFNFKLSNNTELCFS